MSRNDFYRNQVENPKHYDRMIVLLMLLNPACKDEEWAVRTINHCIANTTQSSRDYATGMCVAYRTDIGSVRLFIEPLQDQIPAKR